MVRIRDVEKSRDPESSQLGAQGTFHELEARLLQLPLREPLRGKQPYGAPQLDVPIRLNVNENTHPIPTEVSDAVGMAVSRAIAGINRYPDRDFVRLRRKLAGYLNHVTPRLSVPLAVDNIWAANGSNEVLQHIFQAFGGPGRVALSFTPTYSMYEFIAVGTDTRYLTAPRNSNHRLDLETAIKNINRYQPDILILCSPNNPVGDSLELETIREIYRCTADYGTIMVIDEAYAEFMHDPANSALRLIIDGNGQCRNRLLVTRTMSKAFGAAGLRVGYLAAAAEVVAALQLVRLPYHLSLITQVAAETALDYSDTLMKDVEKIKHQRDRIMTELAGYGYSPYSSDANFVLFGGVETPIRLWQYLLDDGILIRDIGLANSLRVTAGTEAETGAFLESVGRYSNKL